MIKAGIAIIESKIKRKYNIKKGSAAEIGYYVFKWTLALTLIFFILVLSLYIIGKAL